MSKKIICFFTFIFLLFSFTGCSGEKKQDYFNGTVLEINDTYLLVKPNENEDIYNVSDEFSVTKSVISADGVPDLQVGDEIRIVYNEIDKDTEPPSLKTVFAVYDVSELNNSQ